MTRTLVWIAICLAGLLCVFGLYLRPEFMVDMANQIWACF